MTERLYVSDRAGQKSVFRRCSASVESSTHWDSTYFQHWTIQAASQNVSIQISIHRLLTF